MKGAEEMNPHGPAIDRAFTRFVKEAEPRLSHALAAAYGPEVGVECTSDALCYAWEHWQEIQSMTNPVGYLYRVGQSRSRRYRRPRVLFPHVPHERYGFEPALPVALESLSRNQRVAVVLVCALGCSERETAEIMGSSRATVRTHLERGLERLRHEMGVTVDA